jgi:hypothetical protein
MAIFDYLEDRDIFITFYSRLCAKRFIYQTFYSEDLERYMIGRMQVSIPILFLFFSFFKINKDLYHVSPVVGQILQVNFRRCIPISL